MKSVKIEIENGLAATQTKLFVSRILSNHNTLIFTFHCPILKFQFRQDSMFSGIIFKRKKLRASRKVSATQARTCSFFLHVPSGWTRDLVRRGLLFSQEMTCGFVIYETFRTFIVLLSENVERFGFGFFFVFLFW